MFFAFFICCQFSDVETFLTVSLKSVALPKSVVANKEDLLMKVHGLRHEFPQLDAEAKQKAADTICHTGHI